MTRRPVASLGAGDQTDLAALVAGEKPIPDGTEHAWRQKAVGGTFWPVSRQESQIGAGQGEVVALAHDDP